jgi:hypothetical protein
VAALNDDGPRVRGPRTSLSVAVVIGAQRRRAAACLHALALQSVADQLEVIVLDTRPELPAIWPASPDAQDRPAWSQAPVVLAAAGLSYGQARAVAVGAARAELIAFLEDHCYPQPGWAEALLRAYTGPAAAVGYAISNANPDSRVGRIVHLATYGEWAAPAGGPVTALPGGNVSYRRDVLVSLGSELAELLTADFNLHDRLRARQLTLVVQPAAQVRHESEERYLNALRSSFVYSRALAAKRASLDRWSARTRALVAAKDLLGAPVARLVRLLQARPRSSPADRGLAALLPAIVLLLVVSAVGEAVGYLLGEGASAARLLYYEVDAPRSADGG